MHGNRMGLKMNCISTCISDCHSNIYLKADVSHSYSIRTDNAVKFISDDCLLKHILPQPLPLMTWKNKDKLQVSIKRITGTPTCNSLIIYRGFNDISDKRRRKKQRRYQSSRGHQPQE
ncbi:hypothetical protein Dimus_031481 [Dionaea muscipula]